MSRYHNIGNDASQQPHSSLPPIITSNSTTSVSPSLSSTTLPVSQPRYGQQNTYQPQRSSPTFPEMATLPTLPPISTFSCENLLPPILSSSQQGNSPFAYRGQSSSERVEQNTRYPNGGSNLHSLSGQSTPSPYSGSSASFTSQSQSQPYYQQTIPPPQRSPPTSYYPQTNYSSSYPP
ncbi:5468_t:CDS:1, partial [Acaulospora morrowiae]